PLVFFGFSLLATVLFAQQNLHAEPGRISHEIQKLLERSEQSRVSADLDWDRLKTFYSAKEYQQLWGDRYGPSYRAQKLRYVMRNAHRDGLKPSDYHLTEIDRRWSSINATDLAELELLLTDAFFRYSIDLSQGRYKPYEVDPVWNIKVPETDPIELLNSAYNSDNFNKALQDLAPPHAGYRWLRDALAEYRKLARQGGWPSIETDVSLEYGQHHPAVAVLRERLRAEGDLTLRPVRSAEYFDQALKYAVERFQVRHGLKMDGVVGRKTRDAMNVPISTRIEEIRLNMERWRWLPRNLGQSYVMVNTAGYELLVFEHGEPAFGMSIISGKPERPTPVIQGTIHSIVLNPDWTLPRTIVFEDMLPQQQRNPRYFSTHGIRVYRNDREVDPAKVDWSSLDKDNFPYVLRQDPGPGNPLGRIKFMFGNNFDVYLHDTPKRRLFEKSMRALSSGCIRVQEPYKLATYLLREQPEWSEQALREAVKTRKTLEISLDTRVSVYLVYFTAWVGNDGTIAFYDDIYDLDTSNPSFCIGSNP
ncbi:MAG: L,D-transpeptidase family protein, partial [Thiohalophilus sp.]